MIGMISGIKRMEIHDGDGIRTTVFFKGCPLSCIWCHNPESIGYKKQTAYFPERCIACGMCGMKKREAAPEQIALCPTKSLSVYGEEWEHMTLAQTLAQDKPFFDRTGGGVTLSGGECLSQPDFAVTLASELCSMNIGVDIDTCGFAPREVFSRILPFTDTFLYDIKAYSSQLHKTLTGRDNTLILDNLRFLSESGAKIEIRIPLVVGCNDKEIEKIAGFLAQLKGIRRVKVLPYHNFAASRYDALGMPSRLPEQKTAAQHVTVAVEILKSTGLVACSADEI